MCRPHYVLCIRFFGPAGSGGSRPAVEFLGHPAGSNPTVTSSPMSVVPGHQHDVVASYHPPLDARWVTTSPSQSYEARKCTTTFFASGRCYRENPWHPPPSVFSKASRCLADETTGLLATASNPRWGRHRVPPWPAKAVSNSASLLAEPCPAQRLLAARARRPPCPRIFSRVMPGAPDSIT